MGTNYYVRVDDHICPECGRGGGILHIGKSSAGWPFLFHVIRDRGLVDWPSWKRFLDGRPILDEYGKEISLADMDALVVQKRADRNRPHVLEAAAAHPHHFGLTADGDRASEGEFS